MAKLQELLNRGSAPEQILTDIYGTVTEAVRTKLIGTNLIALRLGPGDIPGTTLDLVHQTRNTLSVAKVGEGAEIPVSTEDTFRYQVSPEKWGTRPLVTREMIEDSLFAVMERQLKEAGYQFARSVDRNNILLALRQGRGTANTGAASITVANITKNIYDLESNDYVATDAVMGAEVAQDVRNLDTFTEANKAGVNNPSKSFIGNIFGMNLWQTNNLTSTFGASTNNTDFVVLDRNHALVYAEKRPLTVDRYNDVTRQLEGIVLSARLDCRAIPDTEQATAPYTTNAISLTTTS